MIARLSLAQFRSHRALDLALDARPVVLSGANGAGKTNLIEAVSLLSPGRGMRRAELDAMARRPGAPGWKIAAEVPGGAGPVEIETVSEAGAARQVRIDGKAARQTDLSRHLRVLWLQPAMDRLWIEAAGERRRFLDRATMSLLPGHGAASVAYDKTLRERNRLLREEAGAPAWYAALEAHMAEAGAAITANRRAALARLEAAQTPAAPAFPTVELALTGRAEAPVHETAADLAAALAEGRGRDLRAGRTLTGPHRHDLAAIHAAKGVPAAEASTGEQKALLIAVVLANARAIAADIGAPPVLLLDEVAAHLDADRRAALFETLLARGVQAWMTGTEADLFAPLGDRAQRFAVREGPAGSEVVRT